LLPQNGVKPAESKPELAIEDRLIQEHQSKAGWKVNAKRILEEKQLKECSFQPNLGRKKDVE